MNVDFILKSLCSQDDIPELFSLKRYNLFSTLIVPKKLFLVLLGSILFASFKLQEFLIIFHRKI